MPDRFFRKAVPFALPAAGSYGCRPGVPAARRGRARRRARRSSSASSAKKARRCSAGGTVPINLEAIGKTAARVAPVFEQVFVGSRNRDPDREPWSRRAGASSASSTSSASAIERAGEGRSTSVGLSSQTLIYKGMLTASQIEGMFPDLSDPTSSRRWRSCTSASRPTRSRRGRSRIPIATSRTTARSTRCAATSTG